MIHEKITSVFNDVSNNLNGDGFIQFWAPIETTTTTTTGVQRRVLSTSNQPFAYKDEGFQTYRLSCMRSLFSIDDHVYSNHVVEEAGHPTMIILTSSCAPATPFLHCMPSVLNLMVTQYNTTLVTCALQCGLMISLFLPVFDRQTSTSCVGVVECSVKRSGLLPLFKNLITALERAGLGAFHVQNIHPYKTIRCLKHSSDEIEKALEIVCESYGLTLGQVWISLENKNCEQGTKTKPKFAAKLDAYCADSGPSFIKDYHDTCDMLSFVTEDGITGRTLQTYKPHLCTNVDDMTDNPLLAALLPPSIKSECSYLTVCLRRIDNTQRVYLFEFLWPQSRKCYMFLESLLLTLKKCLPSFKFATDARLGDDLCIADVENPTRNRRWEGETEVDPDKEYKRVKLEHSDSGDNETSPYNEERLIVVEFEEKIRLFHIFGSSTLAYLQKQINQEFKLVSCETYNLKYFYERWWISLLGEEDMEDCINLMELENLAYLHFRVESTT